MKTKLFVAVGVLIFNAPALRAQDEAKIVADNLAYSREFYAGVHVVAIVSSPGSFA